MNNSAKKKSRVKIIVSAAACAILFIFFGTLLIDTLLVKTENPPFFSNIVKTSINDGEVIIGKGILYKTVARRIDAANGYLAGYAVFFPWDAGFVGLENDPPAVSMKFHGSLDDTGGNFSDNGDIDSGEIELDDTETVNMTLIQRLADGEIDPFDFMEKYPATVFEESDSNKYFLRLMNHYALQIEYNDDTVIEMLLIDGIHNQSINIQTQMIDWFLELRDDEE